MSKRKPEEQLKKYLEPKPKKPILDGPPIKDKLTADEWNLVFQRRLLYRERETLENAALKEYTEKNRIDLKSFKKHVQCLKEGESLYVFSFCYANIWSDAYKDFLLSLEDSFSRLYIGFDSDLAGTLISKSSKELRPGLRRVAEVLGNSDDLGVLITNKSEDEILEKFDSYEEFDFAEPGNSPIETLKFIKGHVLYDHPFDNLAATRLFSQLQRLMMPVELIGRKIQLTEEYVVCEERECVTDKASKILKLLNIKMLKYVVQPRCSWTVSSGKTCKFKNYYDRYPWTSRPLKV